MRRYILFNCNSNFAARTGDDLGQIKMQARQLHEVTGDLYRVYDSLTEKDVYHWPERECQAEAV